jgi:small subunit ribosomal protein S1
MIGEMKVRKDQTIEGEITKIVDEAVFVDIGAEREAVIPKKDIDQLKNDPSVDLKIGKTVSVYIYYAPQNGGNPLGSISHAIGIPYHPSKPQSKHSGLWAAIEEYHVGDIVEGTVKNIKKYGAFVELPIGLDGLIHVSEMEVGRNGTPWNVVRPGENVRVRIIRIEPQRKRIGLSMKDVG